MDRVVFGAGTFGQHVAQHLHDHAVAPASHQPVAADDSNAANAKGAEIWAGRTHLDRFQAEQWFRRSAERGNVLGMANLAIVLQSKGRNDEAARWLRKASSLNDGPSTYNLGVCYENGVGVPRNFTAAVNCYQRAAQTGYGLAMFHLGLMLVRGDLISRNLETGVRWLENAAREGSVEAMFWLGGTYAGAVQQGPAIDWEKAAYWTIQAAEHGYVDAYHNAALSLERSNMQRAIHFYTLSARRGDRASIQRLAALNINWR
jgi:TPR repeat protein